MREISGRIENEVHGTPYPALVVNVILLAPKRRILLTRREDCNLWCLPGGYVEVGESPAEAAVREAKEEICVDVKVLRLSGLYSASNRVITPPAVRHIVVACFISKIMSGEPAPGEEVTEVAYFENEALPKLVPNQLIRIEDALKNRPFATFD